MGTTLRSVRHHHEVGLLPEPVRRANGFKPYGVAHLVGLVRINRLSDLGFSSPRIAALGDGDEHTVEALRVLDGDLVREIDRLRSGGPSWRRSSTARCRRTYRKRLPAPRSGTTSLHAIAISSPCSPECSGRTSWSSTPGCSTARTRRTGRPRRVRGPAGRGR
ncbi:MerR family transcriptional regulator [Actinomycetospora chiangmaiensis]|uniref:helix-turn-helix domain-containing protein n=1 Tax=Actinomycetospora chiangmaiensis TaxID=402650 RepID=UPI003CCBA5D8